MTTVTNLRTGEEREFSLPPRDAVEAAWHQARGDHNWWDWPKHPAPVEETARTVCAGDWSAVKEDA